MLRIHQFYPTLEYVKIMDFEGLSQFLKLWIWSNVKIKVIFVYFEPLFFFFHWCIIASNLFELIILAIFFSNPIPSIQECMQTNYLIVVNLW